MACPEIAIGKAAVDLQQGKSWNEIRNRIREPANVTLDLKKRVTIAGFFYIMGEVSTEAGFAGSADTGTTRGTRESGRR